MTTYTYLNGHINGVRPYFFMFNGQRYNAAYYNGHIVFGKIGPQYLCFEALDNNAKLGWYYQSKKVEYSTDGENWTTFPSVPKTSIIIPSGELADSYYINFSKGERIWVRGTSTSLSEGTNNFYKFITKGTGRFKVSGDISYLVTDYETRTQINAYEFYNLFSNTTIVSAPLMPTRISANGAKMPESTELRSNCFYEMFRDCTNLVISPKIYNYKYLASTNPQYMFSRMFYNCQSLKQLHYYYYTMNVNNTDWLYNVPSFGEIFTNRVYTTANYTPADWVTWYETPADYTSEYLTFKATSHGTIQWRSNSSTFRQTIQYSINGGNWTSKKAESGTSISVSTGDTVRFKGTNTKYGMPDGFSAYYNYFSGSANFNVEGNIMSLIYGDNFANQLTLTEDYTFYGLFANSKILSASNLVLPATTLTKGCYMNMFKNSSLTSAPNLPATTMVEDCYNGMFRELGYNFTTAPVLNALALTGGCYDIMFYGSVGLKYLKCLATSGTNREIVGIHNYTNVSNWLYNVQTSGHFIIAPGATWDSRDYPSTWTIQDNIDE